MAMRIRVPKRFEYMGRQWKVYRKPNLRMGKQELLGLTSYTEASVGLTTSKDHPDGELMTFGHELGHVWIPIGFLPSDKEEELCDIFANAMPWIVRAVVEEVP